MLSLGNWGQRLRPLFEEVTQVTLWSSWSLSKEGHISQTEQGCFPVSINDTYPVVRRKQALYDYMDLSSVIFYNNNLYGLNAPMAQTSRRTWHRPMIVQKLLFRCGASAISCGKRPSKKNICFTVICNPYIQGFVLQNPTNEQSGLFSPPHERSYSFASCGQQVEASVFPSPLLTSNVLEQQTIAFAMDLGTNDINPTPPHPMRSVASHHVLQYWRMTSHHTQPTPHA